MRVNGARNLFILGIVSILIAIGTTGASLAIYHNTGDIYLDRSRPGFLPDKEEIEQDDDIVVDEDYNFSASGKLDEAILKEYLEKLNLEINAVDSYEKPFDAEALSNERLGL